MTPDGPDDQSRFQEYLATLRPLKEVSSLREVQEREVLLTLLKANKEHLAEFPALEADQHNLVNTLMVRAGTLPTHGRFKDWLAEFVTCLHQYEVATRTGPQEQVEALENQLRRQEAVLANCLQGFILTSGLIRDNFHDAIIQRFGEGALEDLDELVHAGGSDELYWRGFMNRFVFNFVESAYDQVMDSEQYRLTREGQMLALRIPLDKILERLPGTDKTIDKTRLQAAFDQVAIDPAKQRAAALATTVYSELEPPLLPAKSARSDYELIGQVAAAVPVSGKLAELLNPGPAGEPAEASPPGQDGEEPTPDPAEAAAKKDFLLEQTTALGVGAALALGTSREDLFRALRVFTPKEQEVILAVAGPFRLETLSAAHGFMLEYALCRLMAGKVTDEGGKVHVRCSRQHRTSQQAVADLGAIGLNRIRFKLFWEADPAGPEWLLFKAKSSQELAQALAQAFIEQALAQAIMALWARQEFKVEAVALVNLPLVAKYTPNLQARVAEILGKLGLVKAAPQAQPGA